MIFLVGLTTILLLDPSQALVLGGSCSIVSQNQTDGAVGCHPIPSHYATTGAWDIRHMDIHTHFYKVCVVHNWTKVCVVQLSLDDRRSVFATVLKVLETEGCHVTPTAKLRTDPEALKTSLDYADAA